MSGTIHYDDTIFSSSSCKKQKLDDKNGDTPSQSEYRLRASNEVFNTQLNDVIVAGNNITITKINSKQTRITGVAPLMTKTISDKIIDLDGSAFDGTFNEWTDSANGYVLSDDGLGQTFAQYQIESSEGFSFLEFFQNWLHTSKTVPNLFNIYKDYTLVLRLNVEYDNTGFVYTEANHKLVHFTGISGALVDEVYPFSLYMSKKPGRLCIRFENEYAFEIDSNRTHTIIIRMQNIEAMIPYLTVFCDGKEILKSRVEETTMQHGLCGALAINGDLVTNTASSDIKWFLNRMLIFSKSFSDIECLELTKLLNPLVESQLPIARTLMKIAEFDKDSVILSSGAALQNNTGLVQYNLANNMVIPSTATGPNGVAMNSNSKFLLNAELVVPFTLILKASNLTDSQDTILVQLNNIDSGDYIRLELTSLTSFYHVVLKIFRNGTETVHDCGTYVSTEDICLLVDTEEVIVRRSRKVVQQVKTLSSLFDLTAINYDGDSAPASTWDMEKFILYNRRLNYEEII